MEFLHLYYFLTTAIAVSIPVIITLKTKEWMTFAVLFPFLYILYSFIGPLGLIFETLSHPLYQKVFPISDNVDIYVAHTYFLIFYFMWFIGFFIKSKKNYARKEVINCKALVGISTIRLFLSIFTLMLGFLYISGIYNLLTYAISSNISCYRTISFAGLSTLIKACNSFWGSGIISLSVATFSFYKSQKVLKYKILLLINIIAYFFIAFLTGDRGQLFIVLIGTFISYNLIVRRIKLSLRLIAISLFFVIISSIIKNYRGMSINQLIDNPSEIMSFISINALCYTIFHAGENIAPYLAMVFFVSYDVPCALGKSFIYFILSFIPRFIAPFRPKSYSYHVAYVSYAGLDTKQGFSLHHAADWYFNFSVPGLIIGGFFIGYIMSGVENKISKVNTKVSLFWISIYASLCGWIPQLIRSPIEGYKAFLYEYCLIPFFFFILLPELNRVLAKRKYR